jgi:hypothetical protein
MELGTKMAAAAILSTGLAGDLDSCRKDVLNFLRMVSWHIASVEVKRWRIEGLRHAVHKWETVPSDLESLAKEIAQFIVGSETVKTATILVR